MRAYIIRRLLLILPSLFLLSILVFLAVRFIPGDVIDVMLGRMQFGMSGGTIDREAFKRMLGVDKVTAREYSQNLFDNLSDLERRLKEKQYKAKLIRRS